MNAPYLPEGFRAETAPGAPRVTVITVALNAAATIGATLESVAAQTAPLEHVVIDGGSSDATLSIVRAARHGPRLLSEPDHGIYDAFDKGLALARGEWLAFLNADDRYAHAGVVARALEVAAAHPEVDVLHADQRWFDEGERLVREGWFAPRGEVSTHADYAQLERRLPLYHQTAFCRRRLFARVGGFDPSYRVAGDYDFFLRAWLAGATLRHVPEVFVHGRTGGVSERLRRRSDLEVVRAWRRRAAPPALQAALRLGRVLLIHRLEDHAPRLLEAARRLAARVAPPPTWGARSRDVRS